MSELKLCPMDSKYFGPCVQEKCAWWVLEYEYPDGTTRTERLSGKGHCAALDWGRGR
jgi:hypothetical protein